MKSLLVPLLCAAALAQEPALTHGPFRGHVDGTSLHVWARAAAPGEFELELVDVAGDAGKRASATARPEHDLTLHFVVAGLRPGMAFGVRIRSGDVVVHESKGGAWATAMSDDAKAAAIVFGSCAEERRHTEQPIWGQILVRQPDALVLLGDTPYVDDGTLDGRRRRHREFFAFPPIAEALAAIPTWTTWDDHDYATNDVFGAIGGADVARAVFVDYHAHASYGDGARGIHTSFRRGPIEVFVLDTRSFADTEKSALAPGERSLLGKAQTEWLQKGLRASTAPFKVLACGMVWNGGVRPNKLDCWGNWLAERDALLRWIGTKRIGGVVLVAGDVHRTRVILHPVQALAGYDVPELITSPLAQDVIETNKVDVPGLEFDAGEPASCMVLRASTDGAVPTLTATFIAGDGREFFRRAFAAADLQGSIGDGDAAPAYRRIETMLQATFGVDYGKLPEPDWSSTSYMTAEKAVGAEWRAAVAAAAPVLAEWERAAVLPRCRFSLNGKDGATEFFDRLVSFGHLRVLVLARAYQAIADRDERALRVATEGLLASARHLFDHPTIMAWAIADSVEVCVAEIVSRTATEWAAAAPPLRAAIDRHISARPSFGAIAVPAEQDARRMIDFALETLRIGKDAKAAIAREHGAEVSRLFVAAAVELLAPLARLGDAPDPVIRAEVDRARKAMHDRGRAVMKRLEKREVADGPQPTDVADLAIMLVSMMMPPFPGLLDEHAKALAKLQAEATR